MHTWTTTQILVAAIVMVAAATDLQSRRIPNWLTLSGVCAGLLLNCCVSGVSGVRTSLGGLVVGFGVYVVLYILRAMGAGDVKLMAAVGATIGAGNWVSVFIASALAGGIIALIMIVWKGRTRETLRNAFFIARELVCLRAPYARHKHLDVKDPNSLNMPHGVAIAAGTFACLALAII